MSGGGNRGYKRSWKNLLINKRYQLRFTLFMAGLAAVLMTLLGWWVTRVAGEATNVAKSRQRGRVCPSLPEVLAPAPVVPAAPTPAPALKPPAPAAHEPAEPDDPDSPRHRVVMEPSTIKIEEGAAPTPPPPPPQPPKLTEAQRAKILADAEACERDIARQIAKIDGNNRLILYVLVASGVLLTLGLALFGIKMTHKVAGPLHKVTLYLGKMRDGRYDKVYDLRKGDQLVEFYEHFKHAHAGVVAMEHADIERIKAVLDALAADGVLDRSPDAKAAADALRAVLERKEGAFV
jgi:hypothetical protein